MLCITMRAGDYFTLGKDTVVQFERLNGDRARMMITAPKEVPILRGDVLERKGGERPGCVLDTPEPFVRQLPWNHQKKEALAELRETLSQMEDTPQTKRLKEKLDTIFPVYPQNADAT